MKKYLALSALLTFSGLLEAKAQNLLVASVEGTQGKVIEISASGGSTSLFHLEGRGFTPLETLRVLSSSEDEKMEYFVPISRSGEISIGLAPAVIGKQEGTCKLKLICCSGETLETHFKWKED